MTWRRFCVLLGGLSAESRWMLASRAQRQSAADVVITDEAEAEAFAASLARRH